MSSLFRAASWSPYAVGVLLGVLSWFTFASSGGLLGVTKPFEQAAAMSLERLAPGTGASCISQKPVTIDWEWTLVLGVLLGSLVSAWLSGVRAPREVPPEWRGRFGEMTMPGLTGSSPWLWIGTLAAIEAIAILVADIARRAPGGGEHRPAEQH